MTRLAIAAVVAAALAFACVGCGESAYEDTGSGIQFAATIEDGADKYNPNQNRCPVCGEQPIKGEFYADTEQGRVYFDKQECADKFKDDPQKYLKQMQQKMRGAYGPQGGGN